MSKIKLDTPILTIKGKQMMADFGDEQTTEQILAEMLGHKPLRTEETFELFKKWQERLKASERKPVKVRDYLLNLLGSRLDTRSPRERFWIAQMGIEIADGKTKEIELDDEKFRFLKKIVERNKVKRPNPAGIMEEIELFFPYESGQLLMALGEEPSEEQDLIKHKRPR